MLPGRKLVTEKMVEDAKYQRKKLGERLKPYMEDDLTPKSLTCDLYTETHTTTAYLGVTLHIFDPCNDGTHRTDTEMKQCERCTRIESIPLGCVPFDCLFKEVDENGDEIKVNDDCDEIEEDAQNGNDKSKEIDAIKEASEKELQIHLKFIEAVPHTGDNIMGGIDTHAGGFGFQLQKEGRIMDTPMTTDCAANIRKAMREGTGVVGICCLSHTGSTGLKLALKKALGDCPGMKKSIVCSKGIVRYFKKTTEANNFNTKLKSAAPTRFTSVHTQLKSVKDNLPKIRM